MSLNDDLDLLEDDFGDSDFGDSGFGDSTGFGDSGFGASGFGASGFGASGFGDSADFGDFGDFGGSDISDNSRKNSTSELDSSDDGEDDLELEFEDDEDDFLDGVDNYNSSESSSDPLESPESKTMEIKKTALMALGLGVGVLLIILVLGRLLSNYNNSKDNSNVTQATEQSVNKPNNTDIVKETQPVQVVKNYTGEEDWVVIDKNTSISAGTQIEGVFTVTNITHYAKVANSKNDKQIKSIVQGNISGVVGTFEFEVPFSKARKLSDGVSFKIQYSISENNGYKVVEIIDF